MAQLSPAEHIPFAPCGPFSEMPWHGILFVCDGVAWIGEMALRLPPIGQDRETDGLVEIFADPK